MEENQNAIHRQQREIMKLTDEQKRVAIEEGVKFGRLTALRKSHKNKSRNWIWVFSCECGKEKPLIGSDVSRGHVVSCGCFRVENTRSMKTKHGHARRKSHSREYRIWRNMISRCTLVTHPAYSDYGGRGIRVCDQWITSFEVFYADMGQCPKGMSIDRINNDCGYEKNNCRWATAQEQASNRRHRRWKKRPIVLDKQTLEDLR